MARWIEGVARHETGNYKSRLAVEDNNLFGMKCPSIRKHLGYCNGQYLKFDSKSDSIRDFIKYLEYFSYPTNFNSVEAFVTHMKIKGYFEDSLDNYINGVKRQL